MIVWWQFELAANVVISGAYFCIAAVIAVPLVRLRQLRANKLGTATAAIFFSCAVGHGLHAVHAAIDAAGPMAEHAMGTWWLAVWHSLTAIVGVYYLSLRRFYGRLLTPAPLFHDLAEQQRLADLEALELEAQARRAAEGERDRYAQMLASINDNSQSMVFVKDLTGRYLMANPAFEKTFGVDEADLIGHTDTALDLSQAAAWQAADLQAREGPHRVEEWIDRPDGRRWFDSVKFPLLDGAGQLYAICGISTDVTVAKKAHLAVEDARDAALAATAAKSAFLATMSHEIRTPLNAVIGMTDLLLDTDLDQQQEELLDTVRTSGDALLAVINDVLDFSKIEAGELQLASEPFSLRRLVESAVDVMVGTAERKNLDLVSYVEPSCPIRVAGDAPRLRQILLNLLSNAVKFTGHGEVLLTVAAGEPIGDQVPITITITDTGIGISPDGMTKLFRSFSQVDDSASRSYDGTGLGLAISARLAQLMGGDITATSVLGEGSTFTLTLLLDRCDDPEDDDEKTLTRPDPALAGVSVLIVDDNTTNLRILSLQLAGLNMVCTTAATPAEALTKARDGLSYQIALLDYNMPTMTGVQLAEALQQLSGPNANAPHILLSSMAARSHLRYPAVTAVLVKPVKLAALRAALISALNQTDATPQPAAQERRTLTPTERPLRILLAEDNQVNQLVAELMLKKLGHQVRIVDNGRAAVDALNDSPYDVVLMDVQMPVMDGLEATRTIRSTMPQQQQPHIIAMTASAMVEDEQACVAAGMESYLTKPVRAAELEEMLNRVIITTP